MSWRLLFFLAFIVLYDCDSFEVSPSSLDVFSTHPGLEIRNLTLQNPSTQSIQARIRIRLVIGSRRLQRLSAVAAADVAAPDGLRLQGLPSEVNLSRANKLFLRRAQSIARDTLRRKPSFGGQLVSDAEEEAWSVKATQSKDGSSQCTGEAHRLLIRLRDNGEASGDFRGDLRRRLQSDEDLGVQGWSHLPRMEVDIAELGCEPYSLKAEDALERLRARYGDDLLFSEVDQRVQMLVEVGEVRLLSVPSDPSWGSLWGMQRIKVGSAWDYILSLGLIDPKPVVVAVIDTGVNLQHEDLKDVLWTNSGEIPGNGIDDDHNGFVDDIHGYDFAANDGDPNDENGHGSHCAGVIAALANNGVGIAGVAGANAKPRVMALRFLDASGSGSTSDALRALDYAVANGAQISSNSWGGGAYSGAFQAGVVAAHAAGHLLVIAAGNDGANNDLTASYPCNYADDNIVCVAATTSLSTLASYSNFGPVNVDLAAPGSSIYSTYSGSVTSYATLSGTSMAAPHVTGASVLVLSAFAHLNTQDVRALLLESAERLSWLQGKVSTTGLLDVDAMVRAAAKLAWLQVLSTPGGTPAISLDVNIAAGTNLTFWVQFGRSPFLVGNYSTDVDISWMGGGQVVSASSVHVSYILQGWPRLAASWNASVFDFGLIAYNSTVTQKFVLRNIGNGTARYVLSPRRLPMPFLTSLLDGLVVDVPPFSDASIEIGCMPREPGIMEALFTLNTSSGLEPQDSMSVDSTQRGSPVVLTLRCQGSGPFILDLERFSGAAWLGADGLMNHIEPSVPAVWEATLALGSVDAVLLFAPASNALGCMSFPSGLLQGFVVLVQRGTCAFTTKAQNAQSAGALGILIADNSLVTTIDLMTMAAGVLPPAIPCFLISKNSYLQLQNKSSGNFQLRVALRWAPVILQDGPPDGGLVRETHGSLRVANLGELTMLWNANAVLGFDDSQHQFYQAAFVGEQVGESNFSRLPLSFSWSSLGSESVLSYLLGADDDFVEVQLPFPVLFYGDSFSRLFVSSNGLLVFGSSSGADLCCGSLPSSSTPNGLLAPYWDDLVCDGECRIRAGIGQGVVDCFVVQFENVRFYDDGPGAIARISFEVQLFSDGRFNIMFRDFPLNSAARSTLLIGTESMDGLYGMNLRASLPFGSALPFAVELVPFFSGAQDTLAGITGFGNMLWNFTLNAEMNWETSDRQGWLIINARDAASSRTARRQVRVVELGFRFVFLTSPWGACLSASCLGIPGGGNLSWRSRDVWCAGSDGSNYSTDTCLIASTCHDYPPKWKDSLGDSCETYRTSSWCTIQGGYGSMWNLNSFGTFSRYAVGGYTAATACCACGGGARRSAPLTLQECTQPETCPTSAPTYAPTTTPSVAPINLLTPPPNFAWQPTDLIESTPALVPTFAPTLLPSTLTPSNSATLAPTASQSLAPTWAPTSVPTFGPTYTSTSSLAPSKSPTREPTIPPTSALTSSPTFMPTLVPTLPPSLSPAVEPALPPTRAPTTPSPTSLPTLQPTLVPSNVPTYYHTLFPTTLPSSHSPTLALTLSPTSAPTFMPTLMPTHLPTPLPLAIPTILPTAAPITSSPSIQPTTAPSQSPTIFPSTLIPSMSPTFIPSMSPTSAPTSSPTFLPTLVPSIPPTSSPTAGPTLAATRSPTTSSPTSLPTLQPTSVTSDAPTYSPSLFPTTLTPSQSPTSIPTLSPTSAATSMPTLVPTYSPTFSPVAVPSIVPTAATATSSPTLQPTSALSAAPSQSPTASATVLTPSTSPTLIPTTSPISAQTSSPTFMPSLVPTLPPTSSPTAGPTLAPTRVPTTSWPTSLQTLQPTSAPHTAPTVSPTSFPTTLTPSYSPTSIISLSPTSAPTFMPTLMPTDLPTSLPFAVPTSVRTADPTTSFPTSQPTSAPSTAQSQSPTFFPATLTPSTSPTFLPTTSPILAPTWSPTSMPSLVLALPPTSPQTAAPTLEPTGVPTTSPTSLQTLQPTSVPSAAPTFSPTLLPTTLTPSHSPTSILLLSPTSAPTFMPTLMQTDLPTSSPFAAPTIVPTGAPTMSSTSLQPTSAPSTAPSQSPTFFPTTLTPSTSPKLLPTSSPTSAPTSSPASMPSLVPTLPLGPTLVPIGGPITSSPTPPPVLQTSTPYIEPTQSPTLFSTTQATSGSSTFAPTTSPTTLTFMPSGARTAPPTMSLPALQLTSSPSTSPTAVTVVSQTQTLQSSLVLQTSDVLPEKLVEDAVRSSVANLIEVGVSQVVIVDLVEETNRTRRLEDQVLHPHAPRRAEGDSSVLSLSTWRVRFEVDFVVTTSMASSSADVVLPTDTGVARAMQRLRVAQANATELRSVLVSSLDIQGWSYKTNLFVAVDSSPASIRSGTSRWSSSPCGPCELSEGVADAPGGQCPGMCRRVVTCVISNLSNVSGPLVGEILRPAAVGMCASLPEPSANFSCDHPSCLRSTTVMHITSTSVHEAHHEAAANSGESSPAVPALKSGSAEIVLVSVSVIVAFFFFSALLIYLLVRRMRARRFKLGAEHPTPEFRTSSGRGMDDLLDADQEHCRASLASQPPSPLSPLRSEWRTSVCAVPSAQVDESLSARADQLGEDAVVACGENVDYFRTHTADRVERSPLQPAPSVAIPPFFATDVAHSRSSIAFPEGSERAEDITDWNAEVPSERLEALVETSDSDNLFAVAEMLDADDVPAW